MWTSAPWSVTTAVRMPSVRTPLAATRVPARRATREMGASAKVAWGGSRGGVSDWSYATICIEVHKHISSASN